MIDPQAVRVAVALVLDERRRLLVAWNQAWGAFSLPMSRPDPGPPIEKPEHAALRAAAEVLGVPVRVVPGQAARAARDLQRSWRDGVLRDYHYTVTPVEPHPDFLGQTPADRLAVWAPFDRLIAGEYLPCSPSLEPLLKEFREWGWV